VRQMDRKYLNMLRLGISRKGIKWALAGIVVIAAASVVALNIRDYVRFQRAWHIGDRLNPDELRRIADACLELEQGGGPSRFNASALPPTFKALDAVSATFFPSLNDVLLYEQGEIYLYLRIQGENDQQRMFVFTNSFGRQQTKVLWARDSANAARLHPTNRLVTITESHMGYGREWIVLPNEVRVLWRSYRTRSSDDIEAAAVLSDVKRREIEAAIAAIPRSARGREYTSGADDGMRLIISFTPSGMQRSDDFVLANTWRDEAGPLVEAISSCLPSEHAIGFKAAVTTPHPWNDPKQQYSYSWAELHARELRPVVPWWCVWRRWQKS
jgi:hypothetical protein